MTYSYFGNYGNNQKGQVGSFGNNMHYGYGNNQRQQEPAGGWSKGSAKSLDTLQSGGWGKKTQQASATSTSSFGKGSTFGSSKTSPFSSGGSSFSFSSKGFGTSFGSKPAAKRTPVPISTLGLKFTDMKKVEKSANTKKEYSVYHINMIEMFSQYTSDELRIYDYISTDQITGFQNTPQSNTQNQTTGHQFGGSTTAKQEEKVINHTVQWYQVPLKNWPEVKGPDKAVQNKKQYYDLPQPKFEVAADKKKEKEELTLNTRVKLKGFKASNTTFQSHLDNLSSEQDLTQIYPAFKDEDFKFRFQFSLTQTTQRTSTLQVTNTRRVTSNASRTGFSRPISEIDDQEYEESDLSGLTFIPDIKNKTAVTNLNILKEGVKLIFPFEVDVTKLDPVNNVKIEFETKTQTNNERGKETFVSTISIIKISIDEKVIKKENDENDKKDENTKEDGIAASTPSIIFYIIEDSNHYYVQTANKTKAIQRVGSIVNEYISDLHCYPVEIYYEKKREQIDSK